MSTELAPARTNRRLQRAVHRAVHATRMGWYSGLYRLSRNLTTPTRAAPGVAERMVSELGGFTINRFSEKEPAGYPTLCKGRFEIGKSKTYAFEDPVSLDVMWQTDNCASQRFRGCG